MKTPLVSVVMPVYNGEKYLKEAINSILNQSFSNFEFIILNDGSTDRTEEIILSYDDARIRYVKNETNLQIVKTLNKGIALSKGKYIARMDADDISLPQRFEKQIHFMQEHPDVDICGTWVQFFGEKNSIWKCPISHEEIKTALLFNSAIAHPSVLIKREIFKNFKYSEEYNKAEDYYLWVELINNKKIENIPDVLLRYRTHQEQTDKLLQIHCANKIRSIMLDRLTCTFSSNELSYFNDISNNNIISFMDADITLYKLLLANIKSRYLYQNILNSYIRNKFFYIVNYNSYKGLSTFFVFINSSLFKKIGFRYIDCIKLFFKCTLKYSYDKR